MVYALVVVGLLVMLGIHEVVVRVARRAIKRPWAVMLGVVGAYAVLVGFAFALFSIYGFSTGQRRDVVEEVLPNSDAKGKLEAGDTILEVDHGEVDSAATLADRIDAAGGKPVVLTIERGGERREVTVQPAKNTAAAKPVWLLGIKRQTVDVRSHDSGAAVTAAVKYPFVQIKNVAHSLYVSFAGSEEIEISGPVRIVEEFRAMQKPMFQLALMMLMTFGVYAWLALIVFDIVRMVALARNSTARAR